MEEIKRGLDALPFRVRPLGLLRALGFGRLVDLYRNMHTRPRVDQDTVLRTLRGSGLEERNPLSRIGGYSLRRPLGRGGAGAVYQAEEPETGAPVAVKVLSRGVGRWSRTAQSWMDLATLKHPNLVPITQAGSDGGQDYMVMPVAEQGNLAQWMTRAGGPLELVFVARVILHLASALQYLHERGIVHLDVKPSNVLLKPGGWPLLADLSSAMPMGVTDGASRRRRPGGTPAYMSPEQALGAALDGRSDQYSLATVALEMLTGTGPRDDDHATASVSVPGPVRAVLSRARSRDPEQRYPSMDAFWAAFQGAVNHVQADESGGSTVFARVALVIASLALIAGAVTIGRTAPRSALDAIWSFLGVAVILGLRLWLEGHIQRFSKRLAAQVLSESGARLTPDRVETERPRLIARGVLAVNLLFGLIAGALLCRALAAGFELAMDPVEAALLASAIAGAAWLLLVAWSCIAGGIVLVPLSLALSLVMSLALPMFDPARVPSDAAVTSLLRLGLAAEIAVALLLVRSQARAFGERVLGPMLDRAFHGVNLPDDEAAATRRLGLFSGLAGGFIDAACIDAALIVVGVSLFMLLTS